MEQKKSEPAAEQPPVKKEETAARGVIAEWTVTILLLLFGTTTLVQAFVIPTGSMEDTLLIGDHLLVDKLAYAPSDAVASRLLPYLDVQRGDIIVFRYPLDLTQTYVKRVIGVPGDRIRIINKQVSINGTFVDEPYAIFRSEYVRQYGDNFPSPTYGQGLRPRAMEMLEQHVSNGDLVVPEGSYFAMGDNRDHSDDSRFWGLVPRENIIGKPLVIYWSYAASTEQLQGSTISPAHLKDLLFNFFSKTRWARTFHLIDPYKLER